MSKRILFILFMFPLFVSGQVISYGNKAVAVDNKVATYTPVSSVTPFSPSDLDSLVLWLKADAGVTKDGSNYVSSWADQSGNGNNATQATGSAQPLWVDNQLNGKPVIRFDGSNDYLEFAAGLLGGFNELSIYGVWKINTNGNRGIFGTGHYAQVEILCFKGASNVRITVNNVSSTVITSGWWNDQQFTTSAVCARTLDVEATNNGNAVLTNIYATTFPLKANEIYNLGRYAWIVGSFYAIMDMTEFIIYSSKHNPSDRQLVEQYLRTKYNHY